MSLMVNSKIFQRFNAINRLKSELYFELGEHKAKIVEIIKNISWSYFFNIFAYAVCSF